MDKSTAGLLNCLWCEHSSREVLAGFLFLFLLFETRFFCVVLALSSLCRPGLELSDLRASVLGARIRAVD